METINTLVRLSKEVCNEITLWKDFSLTSQSSSWKKWRACFVWLRRRPFCWHITHLHWFGCMISDVQPRETILWNGTVPFIPVQGGAKNTTCSRTSTHVLTTLIQHQINKYRGAFGIIFVYKTVDNINEKSNGTIFLPFIADFFVHIMTTEKQSNFQIYLTLISVGQFVS